MFYGNFMNGHEEKMLDNIRLIAAFFEKARRRRGAGIRELTAVPRVQGQDHAGDQGMRHAGIHDVTRVSRQSACGQVTDASLDFWRKQIKETQAILGEKRPQDIYSCSRIPPGKTAEDVVNTMVTLRDEGYFKHIGMSEVSVESIKAMEKVRSRCPVLSPSLFLFSPSSPAATHHRAQYSRTHVERDKLDEPNSRLD